MDHGQKLKFSACAAVLTQRLIFGVVVPGHGVVFRRESEHHQAALTGVVALECHGVVIVGKERSLMALENREKPFLVLSVLIGIVHDEVGDDINGNVRHIESP
jgi:hypothetical protein